MDPLPPRQSQQSTVHKFVAFEDAGRPFGLRLNSVEKIVRYRSSTALREGAEVTSIDGRTLPMLRAQRPPGQSSVPENTRCLVVVRTRVGEVALLADKAIGMFELPASALLKPPPWASDEVVGFAPLLSLGNHLVAGAMGPNALARSSLNQLGPLRRAGGELYAGQTLLNGHTEVVDRVLRETGYGCTIFAGNVRISTTATQLGSTRRALGTRANAMVSQLTLGAGREFRGVTRTLGKDWAIVYRPLRNEYWVVVGMLATFCEVSTRIFPLLDADQVATNRATYSL